MQNPVIMFNATEGSVSVFIDGEQLQMASDHARYADVIEHLKGAEHDAEFLRDCFNQAGHVERLTSGKVTVIGSTVCYNGTPIHNSLAKKLVDLMDQGFDVTRWVAFMNNVEANPTDHSREQLFDFISAFNAPITPDGCFVVYKMVNGDYTSIHHNKDGSYMDNSIGKVVEMPREQVTADPSITCAEGLHVCAMSYLERAYYMHDNGRKLIACKVNPQDVVSVPHDYNFAKMRVCRYEVIADAVYDPDAKTFFAKVSGENADMEGAAMDDQPPQEPAPKKKAKANKEKDKPSKKPAKFALQVFDRDGNVAKTYKREADFFDDLKQYGQRGYDRKFNVARTSIQEIVKRLKKSS